MFYVSIFNLALVLILIWYIFRMKKAIKEYIQDLYNREKVLGEVLDNHKERIDEVINTQTEDEMDIGRLRLDVNNINKGITDNDFEIKMMKKDINAISDFGFEQMSKIEEIKKATDSQKELADAQLKSELMWQKGMEEIMSYSPKTSSSPLRSGGITERINK